MNARGRCSVCSVKLRKRKGGRGARVRRGKRRSGVH